MNETSKLLIGVMARIPGAPMLLRDLIIGQRQPTLSGNAKVALQMYRGGQKLAPITTTLHGGVIMTHTGYDELVVEAPLLAPLWDMSELLNTRAPGEAEAYTVDTAGNVVSNSTSDRLNTWRALRLAEGRAMVDRRVEWMLAQQLTTGTVVLQGQGYNKTIDVGFDNTISDLTAWDDASADPISDLRTLRNEATNAGLPAPNVLVCSTDVAAVLMANAKFKAQMQLNVGYSDPILGIAPMNYPAAYRVGYIAEIDTMIYAYGAVYTNDAGASTKFIGSGRAVYFPSADRNAVCYANGAIYDARDNSWFSGQYYVREFSNDSGHANFLEVDARPVACLAEAESWYSLSGLVSAQNSIT